MTEPIKYRYIITGTGRSGSSLLAATLADSGANFDMRQPFDLAPLNDLRRIQEAESIYTALRQTRGQVVCVN